MKRILLSLFIALSCASAHATTWYVRTDGGTATQCTGRTNAAYSGSGNAQACAYSHPFYLVTDNTTGAAFAWKIAGGDTVQFEDVGPYYIGQTFKGLGQSWLGCSGSYLDCVLPPLPSGTARNPTRFLGKNAGSCHTSGHTGTVNPTEWVGLHGAFWMFSIQGSSNVDVECFDFTQPDQCSMGGTGYLPPDQVCSNDLHNYVKHGLMLSYLTSQGPSNSTVADMSIHGLANEAITGGKMNQTADDVMNFSDIYIYGIGGAGFDSDAGGCGNSCETVGTVNMSHMIINWSGCVEVKPNGGTIGGNGYTNCTDQSHGGYGDGFTMIAEGNSTWNISDISTNWNTQDGFDGLHMGDDPATTPVVNITRLSAQGNMGQQLKTGGSVNLTNSWFNGNCRRLAHPFAENPTGYNSMLGDFCRAGPISIAMQVLNGRYTTIENNTSLGYSTSMWAFLCVEGQTCTTHTQVIFRNNLSYGTQDPKSGDNPTPSGMYFGEGAWAITNPFANPGSAIDHNLWYGVRGVAPFGTCPQDGTYETNAICSDPKLVNESQTGNEQDNLTPYLTSSSPAIGAGATIAGLITDAASALRPTLRSIGAFESTVGGVGLPVPLSTTIKLSAPNLITAGQPVTVTAVLTSAGSVAPTGTVLFLNGASSLGTGTLSGSGVATLSLPWLAAGSYNVRAAYSGDSSYAAGVSSVVTLTVKALTTPPPVTTDPPPVTGNPPPVTGNPPPVTGSPPPVTGSPPPLTATDPPPAGGEPTSVSIVVAQPEYGFNVIPGSTRRIFATVTNGSTNQVVWTVKSGSAQISSSSGAWIDVNAPATGSSCSVTGTSALYKVTSATQFTIEATSVDDGSKTANVTFNVCNPAVEVSIVPFYRTLYANQPADVQSLVLGSVNQNVHWAITSQPKNGDGSLTDSTSRDTLFTGTVPGRYQLTATSVADAGKSATAIMYVTGHTMPYRVTPNQTVPVDCTVDPSMLGTVYEVGPSQTFKSLASIPFPTMVPGSTVRLHNEDTSGLHPTEYHEYVQISQPATADQPFRMCGVPDSMGNLPIVDGLKATGRSDISADVVGAALLTLHKSNYFTYWPQFSAAQYIAVEGIQFRNAKAGNSYSPPSGSDKTWQASSSCIRINEAQNIAFVGDDIGSCSNGVVSEFNSNGGWGASDVNVLLDGNHIHNNGIAGSKLGHQMYLQSWGNVVQFNRIDNYTAGALGANIKSRGLQDVIRYNYLGDGAQRQMDLVDVTDAPAYMSFSGFLSGGANSFHSLYSKDRYPADRIAAEQEAWNSHFVYGNIYQNSTSSAPIHFSMDTSGGELARKGSLYWYNNTFYEKLCATCASPWTLFDTSGGNGTYYPQTEFQTVQAYNNIVWMGNTTKPAFQWNNYAAFIGIGSNNLLPANWGTNSADGGAGSGWNTSPNANAYQNILPLKTHVTGFEKADILTADSIPFDQNSWILGNKIAGSQLVPSAVCSMPTRFAYLPNLGYAVPRIDAPGVGATDTVAETAKLMNAVAGAGRYNTRYSNCH